MLETTLELLAPSAHCAMMQARFQMLGTVPTNPSLKVLIYWSRLSLTPKFHPMLLVAVGKLVES